MNKIQTLIKKEIKELENTSEVKRYLLLINILNTISNDSKNEVQFYKKIQREELIKEIVLIFKEQKRFLHIREIIKIVKNKKLETDEKSIKQSVYSLKWNDIIVSVLIKGCTKKTFWGSKNWVDENNNIKEEYKYNEDFLSTLFVPTIQ